MPRSLRMLVVMTALIAVGSEADAQHGRGRRGGTVMLTPAGPIANPSADYMRFMRNPAGYEHEVMVREQKMMAMQQKQMIQYQQAYMKEMQKEQKAYQDWAKKNPEQAAALQKRWQEANSGRLRGHKPHKPKSGTGKNGLPKPEDRGEEGETIVSSLAKAKANTKDKAKPEAAKPKDEQKGEKAEVVPAPKKP